MAGAAAVRLRVYCDIDAMPVGIGGVGVVPGGGYANIPGVGGSLAAGPGGNAQSLRLQQSEVAVDASGALTETEIAAALTAAANDLATQLTAAVVAQINGWSSGGG